MALSAVSWNHNCCRIFTKQVECPSRLEVLELQGSLRLETASKHVSEHNQTFWISNSGPLCIQAVPSTSIIRRMEARSKQHSSRWNATVLEQMFPYTFPPFSLISQILKNMGNTTLVSSSVEDVNAMPIAVDTIAPSTVRSSKKQTIFNSKQETNVSGLKGYRKSFETEEISSNAAKLISQSRRSGPIAS